MITPTKTILVVDDEGAQRLLVRRILEAEGYEVREAAHGAVAIAALEAGAPCDLLIVDVRMPAISGDEVADRIRRTRPDVKVLYIAANIATLLGRRALLPGEAHLDKPFTRDELLAATAALLRR